MTQGKTKTGCERSFTRMGAHMFSVSWAPGSVLSMLLIWINLVFRQLYEDVCVSLSQYFRRFKGFFFHKIGLNLIK